MMLLCVFIFGFCQCGSTVVIETLSWVVYSVTDCRASEFIPLTGYPKPVKNIKIKS